MRAASLALPLGLLASPAFATTVKRASLAELLADTELAVVAIPSAKVSFWEQGRIRTKITLEVESVWLGRGAPKLEIVVLGGVVGNLGQQVEGSPTLPVGQRVVLLLHRDQAGRLTPVDMWQGVFEIAADATVRQPGTAARVVGPSTVMPQSLADLEHTVREAQRAR